MKPPEYAIVESEEAFKQAFHDSAIVVEFETSEEERLYEEQDQRLIDQIRDLCNSVIPESEWVHVHHIEDWWPCQTRYLEISLKLLSPRFIDCLRGLLQDEYEDWRIQLVVYRDLTVSTPMLGSVVVYNDWLLLDRALESYATVGEKQD